MSGTCAGAQVISTVQARVDGAFPSARNPFPKGASFRWFGPPLRLDGDRSALLLPQATGLAELRTHLPAAIAKLSRSRGDATAPAVQLDPWDDPEALILSDGDQHWSAHLIETASGDTLLHFADDLPPPNTELRVTQTPVLRVPAPARDPICFTEGTIIDTEDGPRPIEALYPGDRVLTRDDGPQEILWMGLRRISGARLYAMPSLRPIRIRAGMLGADHGADLLVSPGHQLLVDGRKPRALWGEAEVLVRARDLVDHVAILPERGRREVIYVHLLFARHQVIYANGAPTESFHPAEADLEHLNPVEREELAEICAPEAYGPAARRVLTPADAAILRHDGAPRHLS
ncbi:Hint domain-containing protein [Jannaschia sp. KMU-145]|uniref:Hint domain-containing protein n=1 Tax=Jannaschia halovivens TaxID=3388667 RepID=UPI00396AF03D